MTRTLPEDRLVSSLLSISMHIKSKQKILFIMIFIALLWASIDLTSPPLKAFQIKGAFFKTSLYFKRQFPAGLPNDVEFASILNNELKSQNLNSAKENNFTTVPSFFPQSNYYLEDKDVKFESQKKE